MGGAACARALARASVCCAGVRARACPPRAACVPVRAPLCGSNRLSSRLSSRRGAVPGRAASARPTCEAERGLASASHGEAAIQAWPPGFAASHGALPGRASLCCDSAGAPLGGLSLRGDPSTHWGRVCPLEGVPHYPLGILGMGKEDVFTHWGWVERTSLPTGERVCPSCCVAPGWKLPGCPGAGAPPRGRLPRNPAPCGVVRAGDVGRPKRSKSAVRVSARSQRMCVRACVRACVGVCVCGCVGGWVGVRARVQTPWMMLIAASYISFALRVVCV